uniref:CG11233 n=2 Tax=Macrostomum lignano TaxID=282301 RepID=A0A1I8FBD5_9PLAT
STAEATTHQQLPASLPVADTRPTETNKASMSYRKLFSACLSLRGNNGSADSEETHGPHLPDPSQQPSSGSSKGSDDNKGSSSTRCRRRRERCPKCRGLLPVAAEQRHRRLKTTDTSPLPQPVLVPVGFRRGNRAEAKEDSGCYDQLQASQPVVRDRHRRQQACEDSGIEDTSSGALETSAVSPPSSLQPLPAKPSSTSGSDSSAALIAQLTQQTRWVPRLPNRQAPFDEMSQQRFLAAKRLALQCDAERFGKN